MLEMWTVYERPADYPDGFVARKWVIDPRYPDPVPTSVIALADTLAKVREAIPPHMCRLARSDADAPCVVETWL